MSYEEKFKEINNRVYDFNKDRQEPFIFYHDSLGGTYPVIEDEGHYEENAHIFVSCIHIYYYNQLKEKIQEMESLGSENDYEKALLESMKIDLEDRAKKYHKDIKRKLIE